MGPDTPDGAALKRVAVVGLGVMGGSLARALRLLPRPPLCAGWSADPGEGEAALADGVLDRVARGPEDAAEGADLVVLAAPLGACLDLIPTVLAAMRPEAVLTDVASLKTPVQLAVTRAGGGARWVGSHPMCGSADSGYAASRPDLYAGARVWLVAPPDAEAGVARVQELWQSVGAHPLFTDAHTHDALMALTSHLPQLTANALARALEDAGVEAGALGPGGRDTTRLAGSSPEMWRDVFAHAFTPPLAEGLRAVARRLEELAAYADAGDAEGMARFMAATRAWKGKAP